MITQGLLIKKLFSLLLLSSFSIALLAQNSSSVKTIFQHLDFSNSSQKEDGKRFGIELKHHIDSHHILLIYEKTDTQTLQPPLTSNLSVDKLSLKYGYQFSPILRLNSSFIIIEDNLVSTDGGRVYGLGISYKNINLTHYYSDYEPLDIYQTDVSATFKAKLGEFKTKTVLVVKYLDLQDYTTNPLSKNAQSSYLTTGIKLKLGYKNHFALAGAFLGDSTFAVMDRGARVQHHAMEFNKNYMAGFGTTVFDYTLTLKYSYARATELPKQTENVLVDSLVLTVEKQF